MRQDRNLARAGLVLGAFAAALSLSGAALAQVPTNTGASTDKHGAVPPPPKAAAAAPSKADDAAKPAKAHKKHKKHKAKPAAEAAGK